MKEYGHNPLTIRKIVKLKEALKAATPSNNVEEGVFNTLQHGKVVSS